MGDWPKITGYGRGWQEPLATDPRERRKQKMREPATKSDYANAFMFTFVAFAWIMAVGVPLAAWLFN